MGRHTAHCYSVHGFLQILRDKFLTSNRLQYINCVAIHRGILFSVKFLVNIRHSCVASRDLGYLSAFKD